MVAFAEEAERLLAQNHYASATIRDLLDGVLLRRNAVEERSRERLALLHASLQLQHFARDVDDTQGWMQRKQAVVDEVDYNDKQNLKSRLQAYAVHHGDVVAYAAAIEGLHLQGLALVQSSHYASEHIVQALDQVCPQPRAVASCINPCAALTSPSLGLCFGFVRWIMPGSIWP